MAIRVGKRVQEKQKKKTEKNTCGHKSCYEAAAQQCGVSWGNILRWVISKKKLLAKNGAKEAAMVMGVKARKTFGCGGDRFQEPVDPAVRYLGSLCHELAARRYRNNKVEVFKNKF